MMSSNSPLIINHLNFDNKKHLQYTWQRKWILPYESPWSVFEKFKYANNVSAKDILKHAGTDNVKKLKHAIGSVHRGLFYLNGFNDDSLIELFDFPLKSYNTELINSLLKNVSEGRLSGLLNSSLRICPDCLKNAYHSVFHQFTYLTECPFHKKPLISTCPNCHKEFPYELNDKYTLEPFRCMCGHDFLSNKSRKYFYLQWNKPIPPIQINELKIWLSLDEKEVIKLKNMYYFNDYFEEYSKNLNHILEAISSRYVDSQKNRTQHYVIRSADYIQSLYSLEEKEIIKTYSKTSKFSRINEFYIKQMRYELLYEELYESTNSIINSIARYIRKRLLKKHHFCIHKFVSDHTNTDDHVCPYAFAYVKWREITQDFYSYDFVDNVKGPRKYSYKNLEFPNIGDVNFLYKLFYFWNSKIDDITIESRAAIKWILNRVIAHVALYSFFNLLEQIDLFPETPKIRNFKSFINEGIPFFLFVFPNSTSKEIEFHWWYDENNHKKMGGIECPYKSKKQKRKYRWKRTNQLREAVINLDKK